MRSGGVLATIGTAEAGVFIPEVWADGVLEAVESSLVFATLVNRQYEGSISQYGDTVRIPNVSNLSANDKIAGTSVTIQAPTETDLTLLINKHKECSFYVEDIAAIQAKADLRAVYTQRAGYAIAKAIDGDLAALYSGLAHSSGNGGSAITEDIILAAIEYLDKADAPEQDRAIVINPGQKKAMLKIDKFVRGDYVGANANGQPVPAVTGKFGEVFGAKVFVTNQVATETTHAHNLCFHKDAFALAIQLQPRIQVQYKQEYLSWLVTCDVLYGVKELRDAFAVDCITTI